MNKTGTTQSAAAAAISKSKTGVRHGPSNKNIVTGGSTSKPQCTPPCDMSPIKGMNKGGCC